MNRWSLVTFVTVLGFVLPAYASERIFVYPAEGQSEKRQSEDRYRCHLWAVKATDFDPLKAGIGKPEYVRVPVPANPNAGATGKGMLGGAIAGGAIGGISDGNAGQGAAIGAIIGAVLGNIVEQQGENQSRELAHAEAEAIYADRREVAIGRANYRRALAACLEGRGYTVN